MVFVGWEHQVDPLSGLQLTSCWICRKSISLLLINAGSVNYSKVTLWRRVWVDNTPSPRCSEIAAHRQMSRNQVEPHVDPFPADRSLNLAPRSILKVCGTVKVSRSDPDWRQLKLPMGLPSEPLRPSAGAVNKQQEVAESPSSPRLPWAKKSTCFPETILMIGRRK